MTTSDYDWTQFSRQVFIKADIAHVFRAWTIPAEVVKWFIAQADYTIRDGTARSDNSIVQSGDQYHWRWHHDLEMRGEVLNVVENELFQFTFGENSDGENIIVTVTFRQIGDETLVELAQHNMADTLADHAGWHLSCNLGWSFFMTNQKTWLEHGIDLREKSSVRAGATRAVTH